MESVLLQKGFYGHATGGREMSDGAALAIAVSLFVASCQIGVSISNVAGAIRDIKIVEVKK